MPEKGETTSGRRGIRALAVAAALTLVMASCGGADEPKAESDLFDVESSTTAPTTAPPTTTTTRTTTTAPTTTTSIPEPPPPPGPVETEIAPKPPPPKPPPKPPAPKPPAPEPRTSCDPSYPGVCIPPAPPDLDCGDVPHKKFRVLPPDPHGFDGNDNDGLGCES